VLPGDSDLSFYKYTRIVSFLLFFPSSIATVPLPKLGFLTLLSPQVRRHCHHCRSSATALKCSGDDGTRVSLLCLLIVQQWQS